MEVNDKTSVIDSDFREGAIFFSMSNALLFSFALSNTIIFSKLTLKNNKLDGVDTLAMAIVSGIISMIGLGFFIYSLIKLLDVRTKRSRMAESIAGVTQLEHPHLKEQEEEKYNLRKIEPTVPEFSRNTRFNNSSKKLAGRFLSK